MPETKTSVHWVDASLRWLHESQRVILLLAVSFQVLVLVSMIALATTPRYFSARPFCCTSGGRSTRPFRGDYVILSYDINQLALPGSGRMDEWEDRTVYVTLEPDPDGEHWHGTSASFERPKSGTYIKGICEKNDRYVKKLGSGV